MSDFTKFKVGVALALLGVLFTLHPLVAQVASLTFLIVSLRVKLIWFYYATSALLGLSVYTYALAAVREQPLQWVERAGNIAYALAVAVPPLYLLLWISSVLAAVIGPAVRHPLFQNLVSALLGVAASIAGGSLFRRVATTLGRRDKTTRIDELQSAEVFHLRRARELRQTALYDLSVLESFRAVEAALGAALEARNVRAPRSAELFDAAVRAEVVPKELAEVYHGLRTLRNSAIHKQVPTSKSEAEDAVEMAKAILAGTRREWNAASQDAA